MFGLFLSWSSIETETGEKKSMGAGTRRYEEVGFFCLWKCVRVFGVFGPDLSRLWPKRIYVKTQRHPGPGTLFFNFCIVS